MSVSFTCQVSGVRRAAAGIKSRLLFGGDSFCGFFADLVFRFCLANSFFWNQRDQSPQGVVDAFGIGEIFRHIGLESDYRSKMLDRDGPIFIMNADGVPFLQIAIVLSANPLFSSEIIFGKHAVVVFFWVDFICLLHKFFFQRLQPYGN